MKKSTKPEILKKIAAKPVAEKKASQAKPASAAKTKVVKPIAPSKAKAKTPVRKPAAEAKGPVTIVIRHDVGWGNALHLRGEGPGLSWKNGVALACVHANEWVWVAPDAGPVIFKVLLNDLIWAVGENITVPPGRVITMTPEF